MQREKVEQDLSQLVNILINTVPKLKSVRIFGSYLTDRWNPNRSDIDIFVLTQDENYNSEKDQQEVGYYRYKESLQRQKLRQEILDQFKASVENEYSLHILSKKELRQIMFLDEGKGYTGLNMIRGRQLYGQKNIFDYLKLTRQ